MGILLAFAPFIAFAVVDRLIGPAQGLIAGAVTSVTQLLTITHHFDTESHKIPYSFRASICLILIGYKIRSLFPKARFSAFG